MTPHKAAVSQVEGVPGEEGVTPESGGTSGQTPIRVEHNEVQSGAETRVEHVVDHNPGNPGMENPRPS